MVSENFSRFSSNKGTSTHKDGEDPSETWFGVVGVPSEEMDEETNSESVYDWGESADNDDCLTEV